LPAGSELVSPAIRYPITVALRFAGVLLALGASFLRADPPPNYYDGIDGLTGGEMKSALHQRIANHTVIPYASILDPLRVLYEDPANTQNIVLEYSLTSVSKTSATWNREHLWPRARGDADQAGPDDSDLFHVVPADSGVNAQRGNLYFDESNPSDPGYVIPADPLAPQTSRDSDSWQPPPSQRGDVARALFYMEVRYDGSEASTTDMELVSYSPSGSQMANLYTLLLWNEQDPPDDAERRRNDLIYANYQHNRNPFIDHPEWVQAIWGTGTPNGTGTQPIAQVTTLSSSATETPASSATLLVSLNQFAGTNGVSVSFTMSGTATTADYTVTGQGVSFDAGTGTGTVLIPPNYNSAVVSVVPVADGIVEPSETAVLTITSGTGYTSVPGASATATITDAPGLPAAWNFNTGAPYANPLSANSGSGSISFSGWHGSIGSFGGTSGLALALVDSAGNNSWIDFNFSMHGFTGLNISFSTRGTSTGFNVGTWSYSSDGTNFTVLPNVNTATRGTTFIARAVDFSSITAVDDAPNVTLRYTLSGATGSGGNNRIDDFAIHATSFAVGDQLRTVQLSASGAVASETTASPGSFSFRINGVANAGGLAVGFQLGGNATPPGVTGADYDLQGAASYDPATRLGTVVIPEGASTAVLQIVPIPDAITEGAESVVATIQSQPGNYVVGQTSSAIVTITEPPPNDNLDHAIVLNGANPSTSGSNLGATRESGEPNHAGYAGGASVWWSWTAPADGSATISTTGSAFDTLLAVYVGNAVGSLSPISSDTNSGGHLTSSARFAITAGTTYLIAVDGFNAAAGNIALSIVSTGSSPVRPTNDNFSAASLLLGASAAITTSNDYATKEIGEPNHAAVAGGKSLWWTWTSGASGTATISTLSSNFDTVLAVYTGSSLGALSTVVSNNDSSGTTSRVTFSAVAGVPYFIAVDGNSASSGTVVLSLTGPASPPPNDNFANAIALSGTSLTTGGTNVSATKETGEPKHDNITGGKSVWWVWTASMTGPIIIDTIGSNFDTIMGVYTGSAVNALTTIAGDDDSGGGVKSKVTINAVAGTTYYVAIDGFGAASGNITLNFSLPPPPPSNDNFDNAFVLSGNAPTATGTNVSATKEPLEPNHAGSSGGHSVWWRWTAPSAGWVSVSTAGSSLDTLLAVYTGGTVDGLTEVSSNDQANNTNQSQVAFFATAGTEYKIAIDGYFGLQGNIALAINGTLPTPRASVFTYDNSADEKTGDVAHFYVSLNAAEPAPVSVSVGLTGTATPGSDYTIDTTLNGTTATVVLPPGQTYAFVTIIPHADNDASEFDETIIPALLTGSGYTVATSPAATITLHDNTPYNAAWTQQFPGFTGPNTDPLADFNGNGVANLLEFAFNGDPVAAGLNDQSGLPLLPVIGFAIYPDPADGDTEKVYSTITFNRRTDALQLVYSVQSCVDLTNNTWNSAGAVQASVTTSGMPPGVERVTYRSAYPATDTGMLSPQFFRVNVSIAP
jgi:endonuclease I